MVIFKLCEQMLIRGDHPAILFVNGLNENLLKIFPFKREEVGLFSNKVHSIKYLTWKFLGTRFGFKLFMPILRLVKGYKLNGGLPKIKTFFSTSILKRYRFDVLIATNWQTAYMISGYKDKSKLCYFLQVEEHNPLFSGKLSTLASNSYNLPMTKIVIDSKMERFLSSFESKRIHIGIDHSIFYLRNKVDSRSNLVLLMLRVGSFKGARLGIEAATILNALNPNLNFIGVGDISIREVPKFIDFKGFVSTTMLAELYNQAALLILPSLLESWALPVLEATACGCSVVAIDGVLDDSILDVSNVFLAEADANAIATVANELIENKAMRICHAQKGINKSKTFNYENMYNEFYKAIWD